ncbi:MAG: peptidyl-prolyl cis-trans isomerase [Tannerella sp.]|jgi:hypothetical protein|nr:peptidyl-prolyl cis-trans isomerase [Tannerella sp.]
MTRTIVFFFVAVCLLNACRPTVTKNAEVLVEVNAFSLTRSEVEKLIPEGTPHADSLLMAESYVKKWVKDILTFDAAKRNIGNNEEDIDRLVEEYRRSLLRHRYQEHLIRSRLSAEISEEEKINYYQENAKKFVLNNHLIKGLFLKVPADTPGLDEMRKKYRSNDRNVVEDIEKFSIQNAVIYDYFYDRWVDFDEILDKMPVQLPNTAQHLKTKQSVEVTDSVYCYLLNISEYVLSGSTAPYEYVIPQIQELIINKRKVDFLKEIEEELYRNAVRKGQVKFYTNQE